MHVMQTWPICSSNIVPKPPASAVLPPVQRPWGGPGGLGGCSGFLPPEQHGPDEAEQNAPTSPAQFRHHF